VVALIEEYQNAEFHPLIVVVLIEETPMLNSVLTIVASSEEYWNAEFHSHIVGLMNRPQN